MFESNTMSLLVYAAIVLTVRYLCRRHRAAPQRLKVATPVEEEKLDGSIALLHRIYSLPNFFDSQPAYDSIRCSRSPKSPEPNLKRVRAMTILDNDIESDRPIFLEFKAPKLRLRQTPHLGCVPAAVRNTPFKEIIMNIQTPAPSSPPHMSPPEISEYNVIGSFRRIPKNRLSVVLNGFLEPGN